MENLVTELDYLKAIYELLYKLIPLSNLITGLLQCLIVVVVLVVIAMVITTVVPAMMM